MNPPRPQWRKSSHSDDHGGDCVEIANLAPAIAVRDYRSPSLRWRKSSHSDHHGGECVEVAELAPVIAVRDSKDPDGPRLAFSAAAWRVFTRRVKADEYDLT
ncbi:DUF397 domain-containing protein [Actinomadura adrarensis]|uniref:DUF397 domain-containing protein n=1 Tax=Actinomadura adrarensis TaxID=1819600 RepID=A0ABW3C932_9ACTN